MVFTTINVDQQDIFVKAHEDDHPVDGPIKLRLLTQPADVQVKRVGRASCLEPELKLAIESTSQYPTTITINAFLKVLGSDNKHKLILLRKSEEMLFNKQHRRELISLRLRFLKTIKVQVLKRNLGVSRPEAQVVLEAVDEMNQVVGVTNTSNFAIISDPRYLDEVKKRRAEERVEDDDECDQYNQMMNPNKRATKRRKIAMIKQESNGMSHSSGAARMSNMHTTSDPSVAHNMFSAVRPNPMLPFPSMKSSPAVFPATSRPTITDSSFLPIFPVAAVPYNNTLTTNTITDSSRTDANTTPSDSTASRFPSPAPSLSSPTSHQQTPTTYVPSPHHHISSISDLLNNPNDHIAVASSPSDDQPSSIHSLSDEEVVHSDDAIEDDSDREELSFANSQEEEERLIELVEGLKRNYQQSSTLHSTVPAQ